MRLIRLAAAEVNQTPLDWAGNEARVLAVLAEARRAEASIVCLPELCLTGYGCEDEFFSPDLQERAFRMLLRVAGATRGLVVSVGLPVMYRSALYDAAALLVDGALCGIVPKRHLAGDGIHYEPRWFKPWPAGRWTDAEFYGTRCPFGDLWFDVGGIRLGFEICEDAWVAARPGVKLARLGVDVILNPSASHFAFGKLAVRERFALEGSRAFGVSYVYSNLLGNEAGRIIYDGGAFVASAGRLLALGRRFSFDEWRLTCAVVDVEQTRLAHARTASHRPRIDGRGDLVRVPFAWPRVAPEPPRPRRASWEDGPHAKEEEFTRAVALGLFDYLRKSRTRGFVVSLSGGADSSAVACLVRLMVDLATGELGLDGFFARQPALPPPAPGEDPLRRLLTTVHQPTVHTSPRTRDVARLISRTLGAEHLELDVEPLVRGYVSLVGGALGRPFSWATDDVALQNIQARVRSPGVWMIANVRDALLLATSNRSEAAVGYATMDGDTSGGLSPIGGIDKAFLRRWLEWLRTTGPEGRGPVPELEAVTRLVPTAELRPPELEQTDESDLMPYELLDAVERAAIRDKHAPADVYRLMRTRFPEHAPLRLAAWVDRFFRLWRRNQWKRERYAPSFHLDDENLDPKTWCRFPILSGDLDAELRDLAALARADARGQA